MVTNDTANPTFKLLDFQVSNEKSKGKRGFDNKEFTIQMFGMNEGGETCSIFIKDFQPFFYIKAHDTWNISTKKLFVRHLKEKLRIDSLKDKYKKWKKGNIVYPTPQDDERESVYINRLKDIYVSYYENSICDVVILKRHKLYGFDNGKLHKFICIKFKNTTAMNKVRNFWYNITIDPDSLFGLKYTLKTHAFQGVETELYEAKLPPLLRYFHIKEINPSGWVELPKNKIISTRTPNKTYCKYEYSIKYSDIIPLPHKESRMSLLLSRVLILRRVQVTEISLLQLKRTGNWLATL